MGGLSQNRETKKPTDVVGLPLPGVQLQTTGEAGGGAPGNDHGGLTWQ
jgi:hypothetical protein